MQHSKQPLDPVIPVLGTGAPTIVATLIETRRKPRRRLRQQLRRQCLISLLFLCLSILRVRRTAPVTKTLTQQPSWSFNNTVPAQVKSNDSFNATNINITTTASSHLPRIDHTVLMGQFNFNTSVNDVVFWHDKWYQLCFNRIVVRGPWSELQIEELRKRGIDAFRGRNDRGYSSPMENLMLTLQQYQHVPQVQGVLYAHDDALFNVSYLLEHDWLGSSSTILATTDTSDPRLGLDDIERQQYIASRSYSIQHDGILQKVDGYKTINPMQLFNTLNPKWRHEECIFRYYIVFGDPRSRQYCETSDKSFLIPPPSFGGSDFLYVPTSLTDAYSRAAKLLTDHKVFLECGFPKLVDMLLLRNTARKPKIAHTTASTPPANITAVSIPLCTKFWHSRGTLKMLRQCQDESLAASGDHQPLVVVHPFKIGQLGHDNWAEAFNLVTRGILGGENMETMHGLPR